LNRIKIIGASITFIFGVFWYLHPEANIEPLIVIIGAVIVLYPYIPKKYMGISFYKQPSFVFFVDRDGNTTQSKEEIADQVNKIRENIAKAKDYKIGVQNADFFKSVQGSDEGIRGSLKNDIQNKHDKTSALIDLIINSWVNNLIPKASEENLNQMVEGALKISCLDNTLNPFKEYLDLWFSQNNEFRTLAHLNQEQAKYLLDHLDVSNMIQVFEGCVEDLPDEILYSEVIPKIYFELEESAGKRGFESIDSLFDLKLWSYGAG